MPKPPGREISIISDWGSGIKLSADHSRDCPGVFCSEKWSIEFVWVFRLLRFDYFPPFFDPPRELSRLLIGCKMAFEASDW